MILRHQAGIFECCTSTVIGACHWVYLLKLRWHGQESSCCVAATSAAKRPVHNPQLKFLGQLILIRAGRLEKEDEHYHVRLIQARAWMAQLTCHSCSSSGDSATYLVTTASTRAAHRSALSISSTAATAFPSASFKLCPSSVLLSSASAAA